MTETKICANKDCGEKPITSFYRELKGGDERDSICKTCRMAEARVDKLTADERIERKRRIAKRKERNFTFDMVVDKPVRIMGA